MTEPSSTTSNQTSILTLQLEGPYGRSMSISDGNSREDTISPMMVSQKTGHNECRPATPSSQIQIEAGEDKVCLFSRKEGHSLGLMICFSIKTIKQRI